MSSEEVAYDEVVRELTTQVTMHNQVVANCLGLSPTELKCFGILARRGRLTPSRLAAETGLTAAAITGVVDRLERADLVRRERVERDRRQWSIVPLPDREQRVAKLYEPLARALESELGTRYSAQDWTLIFDFIARASAVLRAETARLSAERQAQLTTSTHSK